MFDGCISLNEINFPFFTENLLKNTSGMFSGCSGLTSINLEGLTAKTIKNMNFMFSGCKNLIYLNIYNLDTTNEPVCVNIFQGVPKIINIIFNLLKTGGLLQNEIKKISFE